MNWDNGCINNFNNYLNFKNESPSSYNESIINEQILNQDYSTNTASLHEYILDFINNFIILMISYYKLFIVFFIIFFMCYKFYTMMKEKILEMELLNPAYMTEKEKEIYLFTRRLTQINEKHFGKKAETVANKCKNFLLL